MFNATNPCPQEIPLAFGLTISQLAGTKGESEFAVQRFTALLEDEPPEAILPSGAEPLAVLPFPADVPPALAHSNNRAAEFDAWLEGTQAIVLQPMEAINETVKRPPEVLQETTDPKWQGDVPTLLEEIAPGHLLQVTGQVLHVAPPPLATRAEVMEKLDTEDAVTGQAQLQSDPVQADLPIEAQREGLEKRHADTPADPKIDMSEQKALPEAGPAAWEVGESHTVNGADVVAIPDDVLLPEAGAPPVGTTGTGGTPSQAKAPIAHENAKQASDEVHRFFEAPQCLTRPQDSTERQSAPAGVDAVADRPAGSTTQFATAAKVWLEQGSQIVSLKSVPAETEARLPAARKEVSGPPVAQPARPAAESLWSMVVTAAHEGAQGLGEQTSQAELALPHASALIGMPTPGGAPDTAMAPSQKAELSPEPNVNAMTALTDGPATLQSLTDQARAATDAVLGSAPAPTPTSANATVARAFAPPPTPHAPPVRQMAEALLTQTNTEQPGRIDLTLSPETLGRVRFDMRHDQAGLSIVFSAERPETLDLVRRNLPDLIAELKQAGIEAGSFSFSGWNEQRRRPPPDRDLQDLPRDAAALKPAIQAAPPPAALRPSAAAGGLDMRF